MVTKTIPGKEGDHKDGRSRMGSVLSVIDTNSRAGSKSSVSSAEGDNVYFTAAKDRADLGKSDNYKKSKVYRNSNKTRGNPQVLPQVLPQIQVNQNVLIMEDNNGASPELKAVGPKEVQSQGLIINKEEEGNFQGQETKDQEDMDLFEDAVQELPEGVLNILIDEGLYEYSQEVNVYLRDKEEAKLISKDYLDTGSVTPNMRMILVDWLIQVQHHLKLCQESLYLAVNILDTVLAKRDVDADKLQLVGITALLIATKLEEYYPAEIGKLLHLTENSYQRKEVLSMERILLVVLNFQVYIPSPQVFLLRYSRAALRAKDDKFYETCNYILDSHLAVFTHSCQPPSSTAASAVMLANLLYNLAADERSQPSPEDVWTQTLVYYSNHYAKDLVAISLGMAEQMILACADDYKFRGAFTKYKSNSQHKRLAEERHVRVDVLKRARKVLAGWAK